MNLGLRARTAAPGFPHRESVARRRGTQALAILALLVSASYLAWRGAFTLNLSVWWVSIPLLVLEIHVFVGLCLYTFSLWEVDALLVAPTASSSAERLAVLITTIDESEEVLLFTIAAAVAMELPHETWVLDDGNRPDIRVLSESIGARYLGRPSNDDAKAGNVNNALDVVEADIVLILDADNAPCPDFFPRTLGYFDDPEVAIVQTPQEFYNSTSFEHLGPPPDSPWVAQSIHEETVFNRVIEPAKNRWNAVFWCGTNAAIRVAALRDIGGVPTDTVTEDLHATIRLHRRGWRVLYHNEVLTFGLAADDVDQFRLQRHRWATGAMQVLRVDNPLRGADLTLGQRLAYATTLLTWFDTWRTIGFLLLPPIVLFSGVRPIDAPIVDFLAAFGTTYLLQQLSMIALSRGFHRPFSSVRFELTRLSSTIAATFNLIGRKPKAFAVTPKGRTSDERTRIRVPLDIKVLLAIYGMTIAWFALTMAGLTPLHYGSRATAWAAFAWLLLSCILLGSAALWIRSNDHAAERRRSVRFSAPLSALFDGLPSDVVDCSVGGARLTIHGPRDQGLDKTSELGVHNLVLDLGTSTLPLTAHVRTVTSTSRGVELGVEFAGSMLEERATLAIALTKDRPRRPSLTTRKAEPLAGSGARA